MSIQAAFTKIILRVHFYRMLRQPYQKQRKIQESFSHLTARVSKDIVFEPVEANGVPVEWVRAPKSIKEQVILYFHGGAYYAGSILTHRDFASRLAEATGMSALLVDYRLAPEYPFPTAVEDAESVYRWLLENGFNTSKMIVAGDSAGGGLSLALMLTLRDNGETLPAGAICLSPWTDLSLAGETMKQKANVDFICKPEILEQSAKMYADGYDLKSPLISPLFADLSGLPPLLIHVGTEETLLDDSTRLAERAREAGVDVDLEIWSGMFHMFQLVGYLPEAKEMLRSIVYFTRKRLSQS